MPGPDDSAQCSSLDEASEPAEPKPAGSLPPFSFKSQVGVNEVAFSEYYGCKERDGSNARAGKPPSTEDFLGTGNSLWATRAEVLTHMSKGY